MCCFSLCLSLLSTNSPHSPSYLSLKYTEFSCITSLFEWMFHEVVTAEGEISIFFFSFSTECNVCEFAFIAIFRRVSFFSDREEIWLHTNFSVRCCFTSGNDGEIAAGFLCCPLFLLTLLVVNQLIKILPTASQSCHLFKWLIYLTLQPFPPWWMATFSLTLAAVLACNFHIFILWH